MTQILVRNCGTPLHLIGDKAMPSLDVDFKVVVEPFFDFVCGHMMFDGKFRNDRIELNDPFDPHAVWLDCAVTCFLFIWLPTPQAQRRAAEPPSTFDWVDDQRVDRCPARPLQRRVRGRGRYLNPLPLLGQKLKSFVDPLSH